MKYNVNNKGYYGNFGGAFIPELLRANIKELRENYLKIIESKIFKRSFSGLLRDYAGRPSPLYFAENLSEKFNTNIYLKREDLNFTGAHKINNTLGQILLAQHLGKKRIIAETGAGQHGVATAVVCAKFGMECIVHMGALDVERQAPNVARMKMLGAKVIPSISGNQTLKDATNEAIRDWIAHPDSYYLLGSTVGPHPYPDLVTRLQAIISEEIMAQFVEKTGKEHPDYIIACVGGGSNAAGAFYHFLENEKVKLIGVEAAGKGLDTDEHAATIAKGRTGFLHGSKSLLIQDAYGQVIEPYSISAGLDYPGIGPLHAHLAETGRVQYFSATDKEALHSAQLLIKNEGVIPALESAHALAALTKINFTIQQNIVVCLSGRGDKDMATYIQKMGL